MLFLVNFKFNFSFFRYHINESFKQTDKPAVIVGKVLR